MLPPQVGELGRQGAPEAGARALAHQHQGGAGAIADGLRQGQGIGRRRDGEAGAELAPGIVGGHPVDLDQGPSEGPRAPLDVPAQRVEHPAGGLDEDEAAAARVADQLVELAQAGGLRVAPTPTGALGLEEKPPGDSR